MLTITPTSFQCLELHYANINLQYLRKNERKKP